MNTLQIKKLSKELESMKKLNKILVAELKKLKKGKKEKFQKINQSLMNLKSLNNDLNFISQNQTFIPLLNEKSEIKKKVVENSVSF